jgi:predicted thioesterase
LRASVVSIAIVTGGGLDPVPIRPADPYRGRVTVPGMTLRPGLEAVVRHTITEADTAIALRSGDVPVLATPRLISLCEEATVAAVSSHLDDGLTTVGTAVNVRHLAPSPVGARVEAHATLTAVDETALVFSVLARDGGKTIAQGAVRRAVVNRDRFLARLDR